MIDDAAAKIAARACRERGGQYDECINAYHAAISKPCETSAERTARWRNIRIVLAAADERAEAGDWPAADALRYLAHAAVNRRNRRAWVQGCAAVVRRSAGPLLALLLLAGPAIAHNAPSGWAYATECCGNRDCAPIPAHAVKTLPDRIVIQLAPGDHPLATITGFTAEVSYSAVRQSNDSEWHACVTDDREIRCLYVPPMGF